MLCRFLRSENQAKDVEVEMFVEVLFGNRFERLEFIDSRVVDENIELAERLLRFGKELLQLRMFCDVRLHGESPAAV